MNLKNTLFALICLSGYQFHGKPVAFGQVNRQRLEDTMYVALSQLLYLWSPDEQRGRGFLSYHTEERGKATNKRGTFMGRQELTTELLYLDLPAILASCGVKRYMHYIGFLLTKTHEQRSLNQFFLLDIFSFALLIFLSICK